MKPEEQRIAIAEACGWSQDAPSEFGWPGKIRRPDGTEMWHYDSRGNSYGPCKDWKSATTFSAKPIPDFLNSLDAMHEAESVLKGEQIDSYQYHLYNIMEQRAPDSYCHWSDIGGTFIAHATASQKAEAFLRTIRKWKD